MGMQEKVLNRMIRGSLVEEMRLGERLEVRDSAKQIPRGRDGQESRAMALSPCTLADSQRNENL